MKNGVPGFYTPFFRVLWGDGDAPAFYFGKYGRSIYFSIDLFLHNGWQRRPKSMFAKKGWRFYEGAIFVGNQAKNKSKIINLPRIIIPDWRR